MKPLYPFIFICLLLCGFADKPETSEINNKIKNALQNANSKQLTKFFNTEIELVIDSEKVDFSRINTAQAELILQTFFRKNPPTDFQFVYQGTANPQAHYAVGSYKSETKTFLVYILLKQKAQNFLINTIQFREES